MPGDMLAVKIAAGIAGLVVFLTVAIKDSRILRKPGLFEERFIAVPARRSTEVSEVIGERFVGRFRKSIPSGASCMVCGRRELLPFRCSYCDGVFCSEHRLPEKHDCPGLR